MSVDCLGECIQERGVIDIIEAVVKHEGKLRKLIKALRRCCARATSSSDEDLREQERKQEEMLSKRSAGVD
jgi:hypothetical protein